jgi:uncharacterized protein
MKILRRILFVATFAWFAVPLRSEPISSLHPSNYVNDFAHVLSGGTETDLNDICRQIQDKAHAQIAVVTINSLDGRDIEGYAVELYQTWGIGAKGTNRGVLILFAVRDHRYRTEVGYGLEPILPDGKVGGFGREAVPYFRRSDYDGGVRLMTLRVADVIANDAGVQLTGSTAPPPRTERPQQQISAGAILLIIFILVIVLATPLRKILFWWFLLGGGPRWGGGSRGGWNGGGFGGGWGSGGGGFGGFGGGMSGGGGASGSW